MRIGVVGYSKQAFESDIALSLVQRAFDVIATKKNIEVVEVVSGLTQIGIPALAYEEAARRGWRTIGVACRKALDYQCFPVDQRIIIGRNWGDESQAFLKMIDVLVRFGGGQQAHFECLLAQEQGKQVIEFELRSICTIQHSNC